MIDLPLAPYEILGISPNASQDEVNTAYRILAQIYHPDRYVHSPAEVRRESEDLMRALNRAYHDAQNGRLAYRPPMKIVGGPTSNRRNSPRRAAP